MAVLFTDSFDHYKDSNILTKWSNAFIPGVGTIVQGEGRCGTAAMLIAGLGGQIVGLNLHGGATANKGYCGFAYKPVGTFSSSGARIAGPVSGNNVQCYVSLNVVGGLDVVNGAGAIVGSSAAGVVHQGEYQFIEFYWALHASNGSAIIRVNNVVVANLTGLVLWFGADTNWNGFVTFAGNNTAHYIDDLYVLDDYDDGKTPATNTFLGDCRVEYIEPTADGNYVGQWTVVGGGTQHAAVDKSNDPSGTSIYIQDGTPGDLASNIYGNLSVGVGTVFNVGVNILTQKDNSGPRTIKSLVRNGGSDGLGPTFSPSQGTPTFDRDSFDRDPTTGDGWTIATANSAEFGVKLDT